MFGMSLRRRMDVRALRGMSVFANRGLCLHELLDKLMYFALWEIAAVAQDAGTSCAVGQGLFCVLCSSGFLK